MPNRPSAAATLPPFPVSAKSMLSIICSSPGGDNAVTVRHNTSSCRLPKQSTVATIFRSLNVFYATASGGTVGGIEQLDRACRDLSRRVIAVAQVADELDEAMRRYIAGVVSLTGRNWQAEILTIAPTHL